MRIRIETLRWNLYRHVLNKSNSTGVTGTATRTHGNEEEEAKEDPRGVRWLRAWRVRCSRERRVPSRRTPRITSSSDARDREIRFDSSSQLFSEHREKQRERERERHVLTFFSPFSHVFLAFPLWSRNIGIFVEIDGTSTNALESPHMRLLKMFSLTLDVFFFFLKKKEKKKLKLHAHF